MSGKNLVLVDCENLGALDLRPMRNSGAKVVLFVGVQQKNVTVDFLREALELDPKLEIVKSCAGGKNALDFQMAFYAGKIAALKPTPHIFFVTKDKGFDALVLQMNSEGLKCKRANSIAELPLVKTDSKAGKTGDFDPVELARSFLAKQAAMSRPRKRKTLASSLSAYFSKRLSTAEVEAAIDQLIASGFVSASETGAVTYSL